MGAKILSFINDIEGYICRTLLALFVTILFAQIVSREVFGYSLAWTEELSVYMFVWFVYFGACYSARLSAHNRVTFQYKLMPAWIPPILEFITDLIWIGFNLFMAYMSYDFVFNKMNLFWKSQTLGIPMKYIYMILPIAFVLMTIRIIQVNYLKFVKGESVVDPDAKELNKLKNCELEIKNEMKDIEGKA
ncbi:TRAP transporter small permease [Marinomonas arenicola]|uniref:TRAP transporter small permease protein n=1 Tax=Marinomonas arenicola TaxID=569601 RepID=A0ABU9G932_9GAMM